MISYTNDGNNMAAHGSRLARLSGWHVASLGGSRLTRLRGSRLTRRRVVDYCRVTAAL